MYPATNTVLAEIVQWALGVALIIGTLAVCTVLIVVFSRLGVLFRVSGAIITLVGAAALATGLLYGELELSQRIMFAGMLGPVLLVLGVWTFRMEHSGRSSGARGDSSRPPSRRLP